MVKLILQDTDTGRTITWAPETDAQQKVIADFLIGLDCPTDALDDITEPVARIYEATA